jgi:hypothetical protein
MADLEGQPGVLLGRTDAGQEPLVVSSTSPTGTRGFIIMNRVVWDSNSGEALNGKRHTTETGIETGIEEWKPIAWARKLGAYAPK